MKLELFIYAHPFHKRLDGLLGRIASSLLYIHPSSNMTIQDAEFSVFDAIHPIISVYGVLRPCCWNSTFFGQGCNTKGRLSHCQVGLPDLDNLIVNL